MENEINKDESVGEVKTKNYQLELLPFGVVFREKAPIFNGLESGTTASVTVTLPADTDTDPPDTD
ncbi:hypothetical protein [Bacillus thuringiensis]|uniref:hypothetical protein n=1 Tax=Bacillus thuringiensis TaxID=1428 RepID=UPI000BF2D144|nr:hypothetical protein [Bacillus thuringiensis]MCU5743737.1 hypothetical protein [Bacillus cereus]PFU61988.1 hypothetical protein COK85_10270 [Bacillus thuringiensis]